MGKKTWKAGVICMAAAAVVSAACVSSVRAEPYGDGDRVCFFGDSVTHGGKYTSQVQLFYYTRYPGSDIRIWNCGIGGATSGESMTAVDDVVMRDPTHVVLLFGMNDCNVDYYMPTASEAMIANRPKLLERFKVNYPALHAKIAAAAPKAEFTFCTLVPWDDELKFKGKRAGEKPPAGITAAEKPFCDFVREYREKAGGGFVDYYTPMLAWNRERQKKDPYASLSPDRIHPREPGGLFMTALFLRSQGVSGVVSDVAVDAAEGKTVKSENADVTSLRKNADGGVTFVSLEKALPFPVHPKAAEMAEEIGFEEEFNRQTLSVLNLPAGEWKLVVDGSNAVCTASAEEWAKGVNLASRPTPMKTQALKVAEANSNRMWAEWRLRHLFVARNVLWRRLQSTDAELYTEKDLDDPKVYKAFCRGALEGLPREKRKDSMWKKMLDGWHDRGVMAATVEKLHGTVRSLNRPVPHVFTLVKASAGPAATAEIELPGEGMTKESVSFAPFPDRMSAYVWRNWFVVPHDRLASAVGASESDLEKIAVEMGLPAKVDVLPEWRRKGYITIVRRNWHLLDYPQLMHVLDMTRRELRFALMEDDFLWVKLGKVKPKCGPLVWDAAAVASTAAARRRIAAVLKEEGVDDFSEEPRFRFVKDIAAVGEAAPPRAAKEESPFGLRLIFSYFADYGDPLGDPEVGSFPEGLLQKLSGQGVNAVWLHTVLNTLAKDPKYPEFGEGSEKRMENLRKLVARAAKYGMKVYLYMNEPRAQPPSFFETSGWRRKMKGVTQPGDDTFTMCTSDPETLRWMRDSVKKVFEAAPGLGGIFTITMSENHTNCASRRQKDKCPRCRNRSTASIIAEVNRTLIAGMREAAPDAEAIVWNWAWPDAELPEILDGLPRKGCRLMAVSERGMKINRGGVPVTTGDYSMSCVGPSDVTRGFWAAARRRGLPVMAKVQANTTWEISTVPYLPVMDLVAEHASNLVKENVGSVMLSWSLGCAPAPNLRIYDEIGRDGDTDRVLDRLAEDLYGKEAVPAVRKAWTSFSEGFRNYPFSVNTAYMGPQHWGCANPLYWKKTGWGPSMVGIPYDAIGGWAWPYTPDIWAGLMTKVADGFRKGCADWEKVVSVISDPAKRAAAEREAGIFRAAWLHFASGVDQCRFVQARGRGDRKEMLAVAGRECERAKEELRLVRADSRIGYESSNHYFFIPQDLREKILSCRIPAEESR